MDLKEIIIKQSQIHDCFYIYDETIIHEQINKLKKYFPNVHFLYSVKSNSNKYVCQSIFNQGLGADAASLNEVIFSNELGLNKNDIYYSAPGKTLLDIENSLDKCILIADSLNEIKKINEIAIKHNRIIKIGIRINPDFTFTSCNGISSKFGIDEDQAIEFIKNNKYSNIKIKGIHVHVKSQELNKENLVHYYKKMFGLASTFDELCHGLDYVNLGSGLGIAYSKDDKDLDLNYIRNEFNQLLNKFNEQLKNTKLLIETGRFVVCKSGYYVTKVIDRKVSYGKNYIILKNTLNGFIRPSLSKLIEHYAPNQQLSGSEPLFTSVNAFDFIPLKETSEKEIVTLVGNACTATDIIASDIEMPILEENDCIMITNAGSYAYVLTPHQFSSLEKAVEIFVNKNYECFK